MFCFFCFVSCFFLFSFFREDLAESTFRKYIGETLDFSYLGRPCLLRMWRESASGRKKKRSHLYDIIRVCEQFNALFCGTWCFLGDHFWPVGKTFLEKWIGCVSLDCRSYTIRVCVCVFFFFFVFVFHRPCSCSVSRGRFACDYCTYVQSKTFCFFAGRTGDLGYM